jgi:hypothetical protein
MCSTLFLQSLLKNKWRLISEQPSQYKAHYNKKQLDAGEKLETHIASK